MRSSIDRGLRSVGKGSTVHRTHGDIPQLPQDYFSIVGEVVRVEGQVPGDREISGTGTNKVPFPKNQ